MASQGGFEKKTGSYGVGTRNSPGLRGQLMWPCEPNCSISKLSWLQFSSPSKRSSETREDPLFPRRRFRHFRSTLASQGEGRWASG